MSEKDFKGCPECKKTTDIVYVQSVNKPDLYTVYCNACQVEIGKYAKEELEEIWNKTVPSEYTETEIMKKCNFLAKKLAELEAFIKKYRESE